LFCGAAENLAIYQHKQLKFVLPRSENLLIECMLFSRAAKNSGMRTKYCIRFRLVETTVELTSKTQLKLAAFYPKIYEFTNRSNSN
jgi:hypothetical protein